MTQPVVITKVPDEQVDAVKSAYEHLGAKVTVTPNGDGTSTITAVFPNSSPQTAAAHATSALNAAVDTETAAHVVMLHDAGR